MNQIRFVVKELEAYSSLRDPETGIEVPCFLLEKSTLLNGFLRLDATKGPGSQIG